MNVLSLFDGMSCGQIALNTLGILPDKYYASEIDKHAIKQTQLNYPDTIQLGNVEAWRSWGIDWQSIDLLLAGSPCQGFSFAGKQLAFDDPRSKLFFVFIDILNYIKTQNAGIKFLLENVRMKREHLETISHFCGVHPVNINSNLVSAQNRNRFYWTNIRVKRDEKTGKSYSNIPQPEDRGIYLRDILEERVDKKYYVSQAVLDRMKRKVYSSPAINPEKTGAVNTKNNSGQMSLDSGTTLVSAVVFDRGSIRESEHGKSQCLCANYWKGLDNHGQRTGVSEIVCAAMRGREDGEQHLEPQTTGKTNCLTSVQKDNLIIQRSRGNNKGGGGGIFEDKAPTLSTCAWEQNNLLLLNDRQRANYKSGDEKANAFLSTSFKGAQANGMTLVNPSKDSGEAPLCAETVRRLTPIECSRLQTVPGWYRWECSDTQIYKMLGNGWTIEAITHILSFMKNKEHQKLIAKVRRLVDNGAVFEVRPGGILTARLPTGLWCIVLDNYPDEVCNELIDITL